jgi:hypothetical protein
MNSSEFKIRWDGVDGCWRIYSRESRPLAPWDCLGWLRFASPSAARQHLDRYGHKYGLAQRSTERKTAA